MNVKGFILLIFINFFLACSKPTMNEGKYTGHFQIFKSCGVPLANRPVRLYLSHGTTKFELIADKRTDAEGRVDIEHYYKSQGTITLKIVPSTVQGNEDQLFDYGFNYFKKEYSFTISASGNGALLPILLTDFVSYTNADTIFYRVLGGIGDTNDVKLKYKVGPFNNRFIDTLTFPNCTFPYIHSMSDFIYTSEMPYQHNILIWGKGYNEYLNYQVLEHLTSFQQPGCGVVDTAIIQ